MTEAWHSPGTDEVLARLETGPEGLSEAAAQERLHRFGPNEIAFRKTPAWLRFLRQFTDPMVIILLFTAAITAILTVLGNEMLPDTIVILAVVVFNAILGFVQEGQAEGALDALRDMMVQEALVRREGEQRRIASGFPRMSASTDSATCTSTNPLSPANPYP